MSNGGLDNVKGELQEVCGPDSLVYEMVKCKYPTSIFSYYNNVL